MSQRLQPILSLLDEGFLIYRRNFVRFVLIAALWLVPMAIIGGLIINAAAWTDESSVIMMVLGSLALLLPLMLYILGSLSRAAHAAIAGHPVLIGEALRIPIKQLIGMSGFVLVYAILMYILTSTLLMVLLCPMYIFGLFGFAFLPSIGAGASTGSGILFGLFFGIMYLLSLAISGAGYSSTIYAIQPWVARPISFGQAIQQSMELSTYRFRRNVGVWMAAAVVAIALALIIGAIVAVIIPLPLSSWPMLDERIVQAGSFVAILLTVAIALPPLPIWMALLYQRNMAMRSGAALEAAIQDWAALNTVR